eukprot:gene6168-6797_t
MSNTGLVFLRSKDADFAGFVRIEQEKIESNYEVGDLYI